MLQGDRKKNKNDCKSTVGITGTLKGNVCEKVMTVRASASSRKCSVCAARSHLSASPLPGVCWCIGEPWLGCPPPPSPCFCIHSSLGQPLSTSTRRAAPCNCISTFPSPRAMDPRDGRHGATCPHHHLVRAQGGGKGTTGELLPLSLPHRAHREWLRIEESTVCIFWICLRD